MRRWDQDSPRINKQAVQEKGGPGGSVEEEQTRGTAKLHPLSCNSCVFGVFKDCVAERTPVALRRRHITLLDFTYTLTYPQWPFRSHLYL